MMISVDDDGEEDHIPLPTRKRGAAAGFTGSKPGTLPPVLCTLPSNCSSRFQPEQPSPPKKKKSRLSRVPKGISGIKAHVPATHSTCSAMPHQPVSLPARAKGSSPTANRVKQQSHAVPQNVYVAFDATLERPACLESSPNVSCNVLCEQKRCSPEHAEDDTLCFRTTAAPGVRGVRSLAATASCRDELPEGAPVATMPRGCPPQQKGCTSSSFAASAAREGAAVVEQHATAGTAGKSRGYKPPVCGWGTSHGRCTAAPAGQAELAQCKEPDAGCIAVPVIGALAADAVAQNQVPPAHTAHCAGARGLGQRGRFREAAKLHKAVLTGSHAAEAQLASALRIEGAVEIAARLQHEGMTPALVLLASDDDLAKLMTGRAGPPPSALHAAVQHIDSKIERSGASLDVRAAVQLARRVARGLCSATESQCSLLEPSAEVAIPESERLLLRALKARERYYSGRWGKDCVGVRPQSSSTPGSNTVVAATGPRVLCEGGGGLQNTGAPQLGTVRKFSACVMGEYCRSEELRLWELHVGCAAPHNRTLGSHGSEPGRCGRTQKKYPCGNAQVSGSCQCTYADSAVVQCALCSQFRSDVNCGSAKNHAPQGRYMDGKCSITVAQGRCDFELGVRLCSAILSGTTKYGRLVRAVQQDYQVEALDVAAVYDIDSSGQLVVVRH